MYPTAALWNQLAHRYLPLQYFKENNCKDQNVNIVHSFSFDPSKGTSWNVCNRLWFRYFSQSLTDEWSETGQNASFVKKNIIGGFVLRKQEGWTGLVFWVTVRYSNLRPFQDTVSPIHYLQAYYHDLYHFT